ncbi:MAG: HNH endonuclease [Anaerolineaceae bacterium]|nr:HNH endonuclease [Anaerolineaceae bacterium]
MRCIFCKASTFQQPKSREHVIPEALGNKESVLPPGAVCDSCNNYFARKVEKPVLDSPMFRLLRYDRIIPNKRGKIPFFSNDELPVLPDYRMMSRLLGKIGLEALALRVLKVPEWNEELVNQIELDQLRCYVRFNRGETWPFAYRTIYPVNAIFEDNQTVYEVLHEFNILHTDWHELFVVIIIFGVEYAFNLGGPELDGYLRWLEQNDFQSPLYLNQ